MTKAELESKHLAELHKMAAQSGVPRYRLLGRDELIEELLVREADQPEDEEAVAPPSPRRRPERRRRAGRRGAAATVDDDASEAAGETPAEVAGPESEQAEEKAEEDAGEPVSGVLDIVPQGHGYLRLAGLDPQPDDVYVSASQIRRCELRPGDQVGGPARAPRGGERHPALIHVEAVNGAEPTEDRQSSFEELTPVVPGRRLPLRPEPSDLLVRAAELLVPLAYGQRVLVRAAPRSGRTTLLRELVRAIAAGAEGTAIVVLLVDERPEEVTEWRRQAAGVEIAAAAADLEPADQMRHAELALGRAKRRAESGEDVVLVIDSLTRLGIAGGDPAVAKRFFGAGRELEEEGSGSLTVIATALEGADDDGSLAAVETTENATLTLDPALAAAGIVPAINASRSGESGEEALREEAELGAARRLRAELAGLDPADAAASLRQRLEATASNNELLASL